MIATKHHNNSFHGNVQKASIIKLKCNPIFLRHVLVIPSIYPPIAIKILSFVVFKQKPFFTFCSTKHKHSFRLQRRIRRSSGECLNKANAASQDRISIWTRPNRAKPSNNVLYTHWKRKRISPAIRKRNTPYTKRKTCMKRSSVGPVSRNLFSDVDTWFANTVS